MRKKIRVVMLLITIGFILHVLLDPFAVVFNVFRIAQYRQQLPAAKARWEKADLKNYQIDVEGAVPLSCWYSHRLITRGGQLVEMQFVQFGPPDSPHNVTGIPVKITDTPTCNVSDMAIPRVFERLDQRLQDINPTQTELIISFDPQYGFVNFYEFGILGHNALFFSIGDCCSSFRFENFQEIR